MYKKFIECMDEIITCFHQGGSAPLRDTMEESKEEDPIGFNTELSLIHI